MLVEARVWLMLVLGLTGFYGSKIEATSTSGLNGDEERVSDVAESAIEQPIVPPAHSTHATDETSCNVDHLTYRHTIDDFISALNRGSELGADFGMCLRHGSVPDFQYLTESVHQKQKALKGVQATEVDIWEDGEKDEVILTLKFPRYHRDVGSSSLTLLFNVETIKGVSVRVEFSGHFLHPNTQTVCISESTRFLILKGGQRESHTHTHLKLKLKFETLKSENGQKLSLSELQDVLMRKMNDSHITMKPILLFLADGTSHGTTPPSSHAQSKTFLFLCELQKFLNDILPQKDQTESGEETSTVSLDTLHSLPLLTLSGTSPQSLLSGLVNSSTSTVFVFPQHQHSLEDHHVELNLETPLLSVLRLRLDEAMVRVKEEAGEVVIDRLQRLSEMCALPQDGEGMTKEHREAQYRSFLLLKALQTVIGTWDGERAQRAARADKDVPVIARQCRLQSLLVSLGKYFYEPSMATINNCEGSCKFPITTTSNNHVILLNSHIDSGHTVNRSPCCVPVEYEELYVIELESKGTIMSFKPNVVATKCECR